MIIKIDKKGDLRIDAIYVRCPFQEDAFCGSWCALFGEPIYTVYGEKHVTELDLCKRKIVVPFSDFEDLRIKK
jgi:hypothetical protein